LSLIYLPQSSASCDSIGNVIKQFHPEEVWIVEREDGETSFCHLVKQDMETIIVYADPKKTFVVIFWDLVLWLSETSS